MKHESRREILKIWIPFFLVVYAITEIAAAFLFSLFSLFEMNFPFRVIPAAACLILLTVITVKVIRVMTEIIRNRAGQAMIIVGMLLYVFCAGLYNGWIHQGNLSGLWTGTIFSVTGQVVIWVLLSKILFSKVSAGVFQRADH